jgi:hypothetical protein
MRQKIFNKSNPWLFTKKTAFMQRIADRVRGSDVQYIKGQIELNKVPFLVDKLTKRYPLNLLKLTQVRHRKSGLGVYNWLGYLEEATGLVHWYLLYEAGSTIDETDKWRNPRLDHIRLTGYELVRLTRAGSDAPAWSWRYTKHQHDQLRDALVAVIRGRRDNELVKLIYSIYRSPGFAGVREQVKKMGLLVKSEWSRSRSKSEVMPELPKQIGYVRRLEDVGNVWSEIMKGIKNERVQEEA